MNIIQLHRDGVSCPVGHLLQILHVLVDRLSCRPCRCPGRLSSASPPRGCGRRRVIFAECQAVNGRSSLEARFIVDLGGFEVLQEGFELR